MGANVLSSFVGWFTLNTRERSTEPERLDSPTFGGVELKRALDDISTFNRWLGGHRSLIRAFERALHHVPKAGPLRVVDVGCGNGDGLRALARWAEKKPLELELYGVDANPTIVNIARSESKGYAINYVVGDAFGSELQALEPDVVVANQFFHHFTSPELHRYLPLLLRETRALVMCDLHRHTLAHLGFAVLARLVGASSIARDDGLVSIRRGFVRRDLQELVQALPLRHSSIVWRFPYRFEVLMCRNEKRRTV